MSYKELIRKKIIIEKITPNFADMEFKYVDGFINISGKNFRKDEDNKSSIYLSYEDILNLAEGVKKIQDE